MTDSPTSKQGRDDSLPAVLRRRYKALREDGYNHEFCNVFKRAADALERAADEPRAAYAVCGLHVDQWQADCNACKSAQAERAGATVPLKAPTANFAEEAHEVIADVLFDKGDSDEDQLLAKAIVQALVDEHLLVGGAAQPPPSAALVDAFRAGAHYGDTDDYDPLDLAEEARAYAMSVETKETPYVMKPSEEAAMFKAITQRSMAGGKGADEATAATEPASRPASPPSLASVIDDSQRRIERWPPDVKAAMGIAVETSACEHLRRVGELTPEGKVINVQCEACGAALSETDA